MLKKLAMIAVAGLLLASCGGGGGTSTSSGGISSSSNSSNSSSSTSSSSSSSSASSATSEWSTIQGNAAHTGFVATTLDSTAFTKLWTWTRPDAATTTNYINPVAAGGGRVYAASEANTGPGSVYAVDAASGAQLWKYDLGTVDNEGLPAYANNTVYVAVNVGTTASVYAINATTGAKIWRTDFAVSKNSKMYAVVVDNGQVFVNGGVISDLPHVFSATDGSLVWAGSTTNAFYSTYTLGFSTPAVDSKYVYSYNGDALDIYDRNTGAIAGSFQNYNMPSNYYGQTMPYFGTPMIGTGGYVTFYNEGVLPTGGTSSATPFLPNWRALMDFNITTQNIWASTYGYTTLPATSGGIIYGGRDSNYIIPSPSIPSVSSFDAVDQSGHILWTWTAPDYQFTGNVIVTNNLAFVSTVNKVYAIDLTTRAAVWSYPLGGSLALANNTLFINTTTAGQIHSNGQIVAIKLK